MKSVFLKLIKNGESQSLAVKTTLFTNYLSNLNPEGEGFGYKIDKVIAHYVSEMGVGGLIFEPRPHQFTKMYNFSRYTNDITKTF